MQEGNKHTGLWCSCVMSEEELSLFGSYLWRSWKSTCRWTTQTQKVSEFGDKFQRDDGAECWAVIRKEHSLIGLQFLQMGLGSLCCQRCFDGIIHGSVPFVGKLKRVQCIKEGGTGVSFCQHFMMFTGFIIPEDKNNGGHTERCGNHRLLQREAEDVGEYLCQLALRTWLGMLSGPFVCLRWPLWRTLLYQSTVRSVWQPTRWLFFVGWGRMNVEAV